MKGFIKYETIRKQWAKDPEFKKAYDELEWEFRLVEMIIKKRIKENLTQTQLAKKMGITQPVISKLESGNYNPSIRFLHKIAKALDATVKISIT